MIYIYQIKNRINNKVYIGQTVNLESRIVSHFYMLKNVDGRYTNNKLYTEMRNFDINNFDCKILDFSNNQQDANTKERYWINFYETINKGLNSRKGGRNFLPKQNKSASDLVLITIIFSKEQKEYLDNCVKETGINRSEFFRRFIDSEIENKKKEQGIKMAM